ncbi:hypothetical protein [Polymorphospora rubra]|uniref:hypothetical protein n=1 Tax=Polymorphospora rubra TaxID=338584 RepID=UPI0033C7E2FF
MKNLFEAAGIRVRVIRDAEVDARVSELLGHVLRATTSNILRRARGRTAGDDHRAHRRRGAARGR